MSKKRLLRTILAYAFVWLLAITVLVLNEVPLLYLLRSNMLLVIHILFLVVLAVVEWFLFHKRLYRNKGLRKTLKTFLKWTVLPIVSITVLFMGLSHYYTSEDFTYQWNNTVENESGMSQDYFLKDGKIRGMSVYKMGRSKKINYSELVTNNIEWLAVHPYWYQEDSQSLIHSSPPVNGHWSKQDSSFLKAITNARQKNIRILLKPHIWVADGWRSDIQFETDEAWSQWYKSYHKNIIHLSRLAELAEVEILCIGTELKSAIENDPQFWISLIDEIRKIYSGKITYAFNWNDPINESDFIAQLDYIGIQAYFPLTKNSNPSLEEIKSGWPPHIKTLESYHRQYTKPILFTEIGYRADGKATIQPWEWNVGLGSFFTKESKKTQLLAYQAFFDRLWSQEWFAGVFIWQWDNHADFSIHGKPAQNEIAKRFSEH